MPGILSLVKQEDEMTGSNHADQNWKCIYKIGGVAAISAVLVGIVESLITFLPGGDAPHETVLEWFTLFQEYWFMGLRNMGLMNILLNTLAVLAYMAIYGALRRNKQGPFAALVTVISFIGIGVFYATNRAFPMLALSKQYAAATTDAQRAMLEAAGQAMISVGASHSAGTFLAFFLVETAGILISIVMLRSGVFSKVNAWAGIIGFSILLVFEFSTSLLSGLTGVWMMVAMVGGLFNSVWYILIAIRLFQLEQ